MKIGIYGGSFNPVHNGHLEVIDKILDRKLVDEIWVMPCNKHAFSKKLAPLEKRIDMLRKALKNRGDVKIDYTEAMTEGLSYTSKTLKKLRESKPNDYCLIIGSDAFYDIDRWKNSGYIKRTTKFIVVNRAGFKQKYSLDLLKYPKEGIMAIVDDVKSNISSSDIRERISCNESIAEMTPYSVEQYILKQGLYKDNMEFKNPAATSDLIVNIDGGILFVKRKHAPFKGKWAFPGGYLEYGKENLEEAAVRELFEETSLKAKPTDLELLGVYSEPRRDPRGHVISHAYVVKKFTGTLKAKDDAEEVALFKEKPSDLAFDHSRIYDDYKKRYGFKRLDK